MKLCIFHALFVAIVYHASSFDMEEFDKLFEDSYKDPDTIIKVEEKTLEYSLKVRIWGIKSDYRTRKLT